MSYWFCLWQFSQQSVARCYGSSGLLVSWGGFADCLRWRERLLSGSTTVLGNIDAEWLRKDKPLDAKTSIGIRGGFSHATMKICSHVVSGSIITASNDQGDILIGQTFSTAGPTSTSIVLWDFLCQAELSIYNVWVVVFAKNFTIVRSASTPGD